MRILIIANSVVGNRPGLSGGEARFIALAKYWASNGHEIHLLSSTGGGFLCRSLGLEVKAHVLSHRPDEGRLGFLFTALLSFLHLPQSLDDFRDGLVYSASEQIYDVVPALRLKMRNRTQIQWATVVHWLPPFPPWKRKTSTVLNSTLFFLSERAGVFLADRFADALLPVSTSTAAQLRSVSRHPSKIFPVACGVEFHAIQEYVSGVGKKRKYDAIFMKRLQAVKGVFDLIDVWGEVVRYKPDARLGVIGSGIDGEQVRALVAARGLQENVEFLGVVYDERAKFELLAQSSLFLLPSYEENWAIVIGEAMAAGIPVICYDLEELKAVWGDNYAGVPVGDMQSFARLILDLLNDQQQCDRLAARARDFVRRYDWEEIAEKELEIITGVRST